jgi:hypothetical protein
MNGPIPIPSYAQGKVAIDGPIPPLNLRCQLAALDVWNFQATKTQNCLLKSTCHVYGVFRKKQFENSLPGKSVHFPA